MSDPLGLSIGTTNLVAVRIGSQANQAVTRRSVLTLPDGVVMAGFVERVGDPVPLVAPDGSPHPADRLLVEALAELVDSGGGAPWADVTVAVPAHWGPATVQALRSAMRGHPTLGADGTSARLVSDAEASLTALQDNPGLPAQGVLALVDFGGGGTNITLADAGGSFEPIDETTRHTEFSGESVDQALLSHILDGLAMSGRVDAASTAAVGSLTRLREECRDAKERLSTDEVTDVDVQLPGHRVVIPVTRGELEALIATPLTTVLAALDTTLQRNGIGWPDIAAVAITGGGAGVPLIRQRLAEHSGVPVIATPQPGADAALGAALVAAYTSAAEAPTGLAPVPPAEAQTGVAPVPPVEGEAPASATFRALAWSQDDAADEPVPYTGPGPYDTPYDTGSLRPPVQYVAPTGPIDEPRAWQRLPGLVFGVAAAVALVAVGGVAIALTSATGSTRVTEAPRTSPAPPPSAPAPVTTEAPPPPVETVTISSAPPPAPATSEAPPPPVTTVVTTQPTTTTPTTTTTTTTTTAATTTTTTTTTTTPPTRTSTTATTPTSPTTPTFPTTPAFPTTTAAATPPMTTTYLTVPFVPPIPIQVPQNPYQPVP